MRIVQNRKASEKHYRRIEECAPKTGTVMLLRLTEKLYKNIYLVTGEPDYQEKQLVQTVTLCYNIACNRLLIYIQEVNKTLHQIWWLIDPPKMVYRSTFRDFLYFSYSRR